MHHKLLLTSWIAGTIYSSIPLFWFAIHPLAGRWRQMQRSPYRILLPLWMALIAALLTITWPWCTAQLYSSPWAWLAATLFFSMGVRTYIRIRSEFGVTNLIGEAELRPQENKSAVVTTGLHSRMRHPIYVAHLCTFTGWALGSGSLIDFVLLAISALITFPLMIRMEEKELVKRFGETYRKYQRNVPLVPFFSGRGGETA